MQYNDTWLYCIQHWKDKGEDRSDCDHTIDTPYLVLSNELWDVFDLREKRFPEKLGFYA